MVLETCCRNLSIILCGTMLTVIPISPGAAHAETGPTIMSTSPDPGASGVPVETAITAVFSEAMDPSTVTGTTFSLSEASGTVTYDSSSNSATFTPSEKLFPRTTYIATITTDIRNEQGVPLADGQQWSFTTAGRQTLIGNGKYLLDGRTEPKDRTIGGETTALLDVFDVSVPDGPTDTITSVTVSAYPPGVSRAVARVEITDLKGTPRGGVANPAEDTWKIPVSGIKSDGSQWLVRVTTKRVLPPEVFQLSGVVTGISGKTTTDVVSRDENSATVTIDGRAPVARTATGAIFFPAVDPDSVSIMVAISGDIPLYRSNSTCTIRWGQAGKPLTNTTTGIRKGNTFSAFASGLMPGNDYRFEATIIDPDGVEGKNPLTASVTTPN